MLSFKVSGHFIKQLIFISSYYFGDYVPYFGVTACLSVSELQLTRVRYSTCTSLPDSFGFNMIDAVTRVKE